MGEQQQQQVMNEMLQRLSAIESVVSQQRSDLQAAATRVQSAKDRAARAEISATQAISMPTSASALLQSQVDFQAKLAQLLTNVGGGGDR